VALEPAADLDLDLEDRALPTYFEEPSLTGNRRTGFNFAVPYSRRPQLGRDRLVVRDEEEEGGDSRVVVIKRNGGMTFAGPLAALFWSQGELGSLRLMEYTISAFRIAAEVYRGRLKPGERIVADLALFGVKGWKLRSDSPQAPWSSRRNLKAFEESEDLSQELEFLAEQIDEEPDRCGYRLVERVFEAFGYEREWIPAEFDQKTGRLILRE
jgi:hypothetical protein